MDARQEEVLEYLREQVRRRARRRGLPLEHLADFAGVSRRTLWKLLSGENFPTLRTVVRLADALGCRPRDLLP